MNAEFASIAEVADFLGDQARDVRRMIRLDGMPAWSKPARTRPVLRVPVRGLYEWMRKRSDGDFPTFEQWRAGFEACRSARLAKGGAR